MEKPGNRWTGAADAAQLIASDKLADHDGIHQAVQLLEHISDQQRHAKTQQQRCQGNPLSYPRPYFLFSCHKGTPQYIVREAISRWTSGASVTNLAEKPPTRTIRL